MLGMAMEGLRLRVSVWPSHPDVRVLFPSHSVLGKGSRPCQEEGNAGSPSSGRGAISQLLLLHRPPREPLYK